MTGNPPVCDNRDELDKSLFENGYIQSSDFINFSFAKYLGGHPQYQKATNTGVYFYDNGIEIVEPELWIPYSAMFRVETLDQIKINRKKFVFPLQVQSKKQAYTIIEYTETKKDIVNLEQTSMQALAKRRDPTNKITIVMDFEIDTERIKSYIYTRILESKK